MKKVYLARKFNLKDNNNLQLNERLSNDFRAILLGNAQRLVFAQDNIKINDKYIYNGPFYCEKASNGDYTSKDCNIVLEKEYKAVIDSDIFIAIFSEDFSVGTIVELDWAIAENKKIVIIYQEEDSEYTIKSDYWFAIANATKRGRDVTVYKFKEEKEIINLIREVLR